MKGLELHVAHGNCCPAPDVTAWLEGCEAATDTVPVVVPKDGHRTGSRRALCRLASCIPEAHARVLRAREQPSALRRVPSNAVDGALVAKGRVTATALGLREVPEEHSTSCRSRGDYVCVLRVPTQIRC